MPRKKVARFEQHKSDVNSPPNELPDFMEPLEPNRTPEFMKADVGIGLEKIGADDVVWLTPDGDGELEFRLPKQGYEQYSPVDLILLAIIRAYPKEGQRKRPDANEHERLKDARDALFGTPKLDRGRPGTEDEILLKVAWSLHEAIVAGKGDEVKLTSLIFARSPTLSCVTAKAASTNSTCAGSELSLTGTARIRGRPRLDRHSFALDGGRIARKAVSG
jgi:hypothetical protein